MRLCLHCKHGFEQDSWLCPACGFHPAVDDGVLQFAPDVNQDEKGFDPKAFQNLYELEAKNFWFRSRNRLITWAIERYFTSAKCFLEIGCGTGFVLSAIRSEFPELRCAGSEIHSAGLDFAQSRIEGSQLWQMDARRIPFKNEFDVIGAFDVLEHIAEDESVLSQMFQAVRPGGGILLTVPQHPWLWSHADERACHVRRYTRNELKRKVTQAGFEIVRRTSFVSFLLPFMAVSRLKERLSRAEPAAELDLPSRLNSVFEKVMGFEARFVRAGVNWPAGGSLLLIARKPA